MFNVYGILCKTTWKVYYGSTELTVEERLEKHEISYRSYLKGKCRYCSSYEIIKNNNYDIKLLEECDSKLQMCNREDYYIITFPCVNKYRARVPGRTKKEYYQDNKEKILEKRKEYREANKEKMAEYHKEYYQNNKEKFSEQSKKYYEDNKEKILEKSKKNI